MSGTTESYALKRDFQANTRWVKIPNTSQISRKSSHHSTLVWQHNTICGKTLSNSICTRASRSHLAMPELQTLLPAMGSSYQFPAPDTCSSLSKHLATWPKRRPSSNDATRWLRHQSRPMPAVGLVAAQSGNAHMERFRWAATGIHPCVRYRACETRHRRHKGEWSPSFTLKPV